MAEATAEEKGKSIFLDVSIYSRLVLLTSVQFCIFYVLFCFYIARLTAAICVFFLQVFRRADKNGRSNKLKLFVIYVEYFHSS